ncbi:hypothetical protein HD597_001888 [Nonomuraea thailandensis]|uniref:Uncharacterized protein n=1 Tax=Nonomuraea thailandensis TaxID=1188745 RepID=A0A9X2GIQ7_9ACTN|nr:hypothetical protein [Nonomuraea thailandensis]MCP2354868.1 hypothetical protein [Nonomuraea thailandensis]
MKITLIAAGGALATAAALVVLATPATAVQADCNLSLGDATRSLGIDAWGVYAGKRDAKACESDHVARDKQEYDKTEYKTEYDKREYDKWSHDNGAYWNNANYWGAQDHDSAAYWAPRHYGNHRWGYGDNWGQSDQDWSASPYRF